MFRYTCSRSWRSDDGERVNPSIFFFMNFLLRSTKCLEQATHLFVVSLYCITLYQALRYQVLRKVAKIRHACRFCTSFSQSLHITVLASVICCFKAMLHVFCANNFAIKGSQDSRDSIGFCFRKIIFIIHVMQVFVKRDLTVSIKGY